MHTTRAFGRFPAAPSRARATTLPDSLETDFIVFSDAAVVPSSLNPGGGVTLDAAVENTSTEYTITVKCVWLAEGDALAADSVTLSPGDSANVFQTLTYDEMTANIGTNKTVQVSARLEIDVPFLGTVETREIDSGTLDISDGTSDGGDGGDGGDGETGGIVVDDRVALAAAAFAGAFLAAR